MAIKISGETVVDDSKKGLFNDVVVKGGAGESGEITLNCENNSHGVKLKGPAHSAGADYTLTLPDTSGNNGEVLTTDGSGAMSWEEVVGNEISGTAPTSPSQGALWTDTSEDPAAPILKTWNGSAWVAVGSAAPSEFAPVIDDVTLTENDTTGARFTSQTFDVDVNMLIEGVPHSQKGLKGEVTAEFNVYPASEPVSSNVVTTFPNNNRQTWSFSWPQYGTARVYATNPAGFPQWYLMEGQNGSTLNLRSGGPGEYGDTQAYHGNATSFRQAVYIQASGTYYYIYSATRYKDNNGYAKAFRRRADGTDDWTGFNPGYEMSPPVYDDVYDVWWHSSSSGSNSTIRKGTTHLSNDLGEQTRGYSSQSGTGIIALGTDRVVFSRRNSQNGRIYCEVYTRDAGSMQHLGSATITTFNANCTYLNFAGGWFFIKVDGTIKKSSDALTWNTVTIGNSDFDLLEVVFNPSTNNIEAYGQDYTNSKLEMWTSNNGGATWVLAHEDQITSTTTPNNVLFGGGKVIWYGYANGYYNEHYYPRNEQTLTLSGTGADYSSFNVGDLIRPEGSTSLSERGTITSISGADIEVESDYIYQAGDKIEAVYPTNSSVSTRYLVISATGAVTGTVGSDPGYVSVGPDTNQTLTFPATFDTGNAPDDELGAGTYIKVSAQATNTSGSSEFGPSNIVTPS